MEKSKNKEVEKKKKDKLNKVKELLNPKEENINSPIDYITTVGQLSSRNNGGNDYTVSTERLDTMTDKDFKDIVIEGINDSDDMPFGTALDYLNANIFNPNYPCRYYSNNGMEYLKTKIQDNIILITHTGSNDGKLIYNMYINYEGNIKSHESIVESEIISIVGSIQTGRNDGEITTIEDYN